MQHRQALLLTLLTVGRKYYTVDENQKQKTGDVHFRGNGLSCDIIGESVACDDTEHIQRKQKQIPEVCSFHSVLEPFRWKESDDSGVFIPIIRHRGMHGAA